MLLDAIPLEERLRRMKVTPVFRANLQAYREKKYRVIGNQGSTRSSKTYSLNQLMVRIACEQTKAITICSPSLPHLKRGARRDFLDIMQSSDLFEEENFNRTDNVYTFPETGSYIEFFGVDDQGKVRGPGRDILYVNEAILFPYHIYKQLALRTKEVIFLDFNAADEFSWVYDVVDSPGNKLIISNYGNNRANLSKEQIEEIESLKETDENLWRVFGLGLRGTSSETIYTHWKICKSLPMRGEIFYGQDFGYNVPSATVLVELWENAVYVHQVIYETKLTTNDLIERYKSIGMSKTAAIYCDSAEPKTIEELRRAGYNAFSADKDVTEGIRKIRGTKIFVTQESVDLIKEFKSYKWKTKDGIVLDEPVKFNDHTMDAMRYAIFTKLTTPAINWDAQ